MTGASRERDNCNNGEDVLDVDDFKVCFTPILTCPEGVVGMFEEGWVGWGIYGHDCQCLEIALDSGLKEELNFAVVDCIITEKLEKYRGE